MPLRIQFGVAGDEFAQLDRAFTRLGEGARDLRPAWEQMATRIEDITEEHIESQGVRGRTPYAALSRAYATAKARRFGELPILIRSRRMFEGLTVRGHPDHVRRIEPLEMEVGIDQQTVPYARFHQSGTRRMPRRPVLVLTEEDKADLTVIVQRHLIAEFRQSQAARNAGFSPEP